MFIFSKTVSLNGLQRCVNNLAQSRFPPRRNFGKIGIVGVPFDKGQQKRGVGLGPDVIRGLGLIRELGALGHDVVDFGDVEYEPADAATEQGLITNMKKLGHIAACHEQTSKRIKSVMDEGYQCLCLGGDHSLAIGSIDGHIQSRGDIAVLWIDAHADLNTAQTSPTGNMHGMPVALLAKELSDYWPYLPGMDWLVPKLSIRNVAYIGLRDIDPYERVLIEKFNITSFGMDEVEKYGIHEVTRMALRRIDPLNDRSLHVSYDIDSLDPSEAPSTGTSVRGGLTLREGIQILEDVHQTGRLNMMDLVEVNPDIGSPSDVEKTIEASRHLIRAAFGHTRKGLLLPEMKELDHKVISGDHRRQ